LGWEDIFKPTTGNDRLHEDSNDNGVKVVNFDSSNSLAVKSMMFQHQSIHKYNWPSPIGRFTVRLIMYWQIRDGVQVYSMYSLSGGADSNIDHYLVAAKVMERLAVSKQAAQILMWKDLISS